MLNMEHLDAGVIEIDELQIVELLKDEVARIVEYVAARMLADAIEKHFKGCAVVKILSWMNFKTKIHSGFVEGVKNWKPALGELFEGSFDKTYRTLRPRINVGPG